MCGLTGFWDRSDAPQEAREAVARRMASTLIHRGPDDEGVWIDAEAGLALAHRRLAVLDLSLAGHQPMISPKGRYVLAFNGEIYNHLDLRQALGRADAMAWRGHSDTETLLAAFEQWGVKETLRQTVGMFALALWDRAERTLTLARDRMGEKPLYYGWQGTAFLFGSELKALRPHPAFRGNIDRAALSNYLAFGYIPTPKSIYEGIYKLTPGTFLTLPYATWAAGALPEPQPYWSLRQVVTIARAYPFCGSEEEAIAELERQLRQAVKVQMLADVPVGAFLSGGIDSSTIVALMQAESPRPVRTFTIAFPGWHLNEADHARAVAQHLGCDHTELPVTEAQLLETVAALPIFFDEPFADASQIPTFLIARLARQQVTVSLSGDGGDELFGGYARYHWPARASGLIGRLAACPARLRHLMAAVLRRLPIATEEKRRHYAQLLQHEPRAIYRYGGLLHWDPLPLLTSSAADPFAICWPAWSPGQLAERMAYFDQMTYLPDDLLVKIDRVAMAVSLETRMPFLDHRLVEWSWRLPLAMKLRNGQGKWLLRLLLYRYVPQSLVDRPKTPFGVPLDRWLRGPLRAWAEALLAEDRLRREAIFDPAPIRQRWQQHLSGQRNHAQLLWNILVYQAWREQP